jgi:hypothetical protein
MQQLQMENKLRKQASKQASKVGCSGSLIDLPAGEDLLAFTSPATPFLRPP